MYVARDSDARPLLRTVIKQFEMKNADEDEVLRLMPPPMRRSTIKFVYSDLVSKMLLFKGLNEAVTMEMLVALRPHYVQKGELVVEEVRPVVLDPNSLAVRLVACQRGISSDF